MRLILTAALLFTMLAAVSVVPAAEESSEQDAALVPGDWDKCWPMPGQNPQRTYCAPYPGPQIGEVEWILDVGREDPSNLVVDERGHVWFAFPDQLWEVSDEGEIEQVVKLPRTQYYSLFLLNGRVYCVEVGHWPSGEPFAEEPLGHSRLVCVSLDGSYTVSELPDHVEWGWCVSDQGVLLFFNWYSGIYAYDLETGSTLWRYDPLEGLETESIQFEFPDGNRGEWSTHPRLAFSPLVCSHEGTVFACIGVGVHAITESGNSLWAVDFSDYWNNLECRIPWDEWPDCQSQSLPRFLHVLAVGVDELFIGLAGNIVGACDLASGQYLWSVAPVRNGCSNPVIGEQDIAFTHSMDMSVLETGPSGQTAELFDRLYDPSEYCSVKHAELVGDSEGSLYFCHQLPHEWDDSGWATASRRGVVVKLDTEGNYHWATSIPGGPVSEPVLSPNGRLYIYTSQGKLVAVH